MVGFEYIFICYYLHPANIYIFKVNNRNTRKRSEICSKLTIKTSDRWERSHINVFIEYLVHKVIITVTRFFVSFIKIPVLLTISILKKLYLNCAWNYKSITFASKNQFKVTQSPHGSQWLFPNANVWFVFLEVFLQWLKPEAYLEPSRLR